MYRLYGLAYTACIYDCAWYVAESVGASVRASTRMPACVRRLHVLAQARPTMLSIPLVRVVSAVTRVAFSAGRPVVDVSHVLCVLQSSYELVQYIPGNTFVQQGY